MIASGHELFKKEFHHHQWIDLSCFFFNLINLIGIHHLMTWRFGDAPKRWFSSIVPSIIYRWIRCCCCFVFAFREKGKAISWISVMDYCSLDLIRFNSLPSIRSLGFFIYEQQQSIQHWFSIRYYHLVSITSIWIQSNRIQSYLFELTLTLETKSGRILPLIYVTKYDTT